MLLDAETRRRGETRGEHLFRIGFRACKATQESQNLRARRQRRSYGFAARLTLGWKADQRSARRIPQRGLVHSVGGSGASIEVAEATHAAVHGCGGALDNPQRTERRHRFRQGRAYHGEFAWMWTPATTMGKQ